MYISKIKVELGGGNMEKITLPLKKVEKFAFTSGAFGKDILFGFVGAFLLFYYTNIMGISAGIAGMIILIVRLIDAVFDIWLGANVDKVKTKWGKFRPFLLFGAIPYGAVTALLFFAPDMPETGKIVYAFSLYLVHSLLYSIIGIPHAALNTVMTDNEKERSQLSSLLVFGALCGGLISGVATPSIVTLFPTEKIGYGIVALIFASLSTISILFCFAKTKEQNNQVNKENTTEVNSIKMKEALKAVFRNKAFILLSISFLFAMMSSFISSAMGIYYFTYIIKNVNLLGINGLVGTVFTVIFTAFSSIFIMKLGKKKLFVLGSIITLVSKIVLFFVPGSNFLLVLALNVIGGVAGIAVVVAAWAALPDVTDYTVKKEKVHIEGMFYSIFNFFQKVGQSLSSAITGGVLAYFGYKSGEAVQSASGIAGVLWGNTIIAGIIMIVPIILMWFYNLEKEQVQPTDINHTARTAEQNK